MTLPGDPPGFLRDPFSGRRRGTGEVYRATDTKGKREVAITALPEALKTERAAGETVERMIGTNLGPDEDTAERRSP
jgi:hypothetical protein